jgi:hypothetical protein
VGTAPLDLKIQTRGADLKRALPNPTPAPTTRLSPPTFLGTFCTRRRNRAAAITRPTFSHQDDADLNDQVHDLLREFSHEEDPDYCFIEADMRENDTNGTGEAELLPVLHKEVMSGSIAQTYVGTDSFSWRSQYPLRDRVRKRASPARNQLSECPRRRQVPFWRMGSLSSTHFSNDQTPLFGRAWRNADSSGEGG